MIGQAGAGGQQERGGRATSIAGRIARRSAGLVALFGAVLLVVGFAMGVPSVQPPAPVYTAGQQAQLDAEGRYRTLAAEARAAATTDPALGGMLTALADDLTAQSDAVALPRSPASPDAPTSAPASASVSAPASAPVDGARVMALLRDSALRSLRDAGGAEPGPARVLASAGANQWRHAVVLGAALGEDPGLPPVEASPGADLTAGSASGSPDGDVPADCDGTPLGPEADRQALLSARTAEEQARFGYEVAAALLPEAAPLLARSATHGAAADAAARRLAGLCTEVAPAPAGFAIDRAFRADPAAALRELEEDHVGLYAGLVATVGPDTRAWAVASYNAAVQRSIDAGTPLVTFPGLGAGPAASGQGGPTEPADG